MELLLTALSPSTGRELLAKSGNTGAEPEEGGDIKRQVNSFELRPLLWLGVTRATEVKAYFLKGILPHSPSLTVMMRWPSRP